VALAEGAIRQSGLTPRSGDILVFTSKVVAKSQGRFVALASVEPGARALELAALTGKDPRLVEVILSETREIIRTSPHVIIVETHGGFILANAGIDQSNLATHDQGQRVLLLPTDPDGAAKQFKARLDRHFDCDLGVVISDSVGRPWRLGTVGIAIGAAGIPSLWDRRGEPDRTGRRLEVTEVAFADAVASAAVLAMGEGAEGRPAALVRGFMASAPAHPAAALLRPKQMDLFR
jgi:coenzyme F420-0:L-glutamate ligase/coenzyme F420-1:gamma-L-glutamate ligase